MIGRCEFFKFMTVSFMKRHFDELQEAIHWTPYSLPVVVGSLSRKRNYAISNL